MLTKEDMEEIAEECISLAFWSGLWLGVIGSAIVVFLFWWWG